MTIEQRMNELGIILPEIPKATGVYSLYRGFGENFVYISGCGPAINGVNAHLGKLGRDVSIEEGQDAAKNCMLNALAILKENLESLDQIKSFVKLLGFVASTDDFYHQTQVINGATTFLSNIFGEQIGIGARSAIGTNVLPGNIPVEIELILELR